MKHIWIIGTISIFIIATAMIFGMKIPQFPLSGGVKQNILPDNVARGLENAYFAWGCFWCMEGIFEWQPWVEKAVVWYIGWTVKEANYRQVSTGKTEHREAVKVSYDPANIDFEKIVELFWTQIDPTDPNGQFADKWFHYTTAIYYSNDQEKSIIEASKKALVDSGKFDKDIVTKILSVTEFFEAESYHQDYYKKSSFRYNLYAKGSGRKWFIEENWAERIGELNEQTYGEEALRERLTPLEYAVTQQDATEPAYDNKYWNNKQPWIYVDIIDGTPLYSSIDKYDSKTGWPSFSKAIKDENVFTKTDRKLFISRTEARSVSSDAHLGHIFQDGPEEQWGLRHCINSASLRFIPVDELEQEWYTEYVELFE